MKQRRCNRRSLKGRFLRGRSAVSALVFLLLSLPLAAANDGASSWVPNPPQLSARNYLLMDFHSGKILAEKNADQAIDPASITKLMTAYVAYEALEDGLIAMNDSVRISKKAARLGGSKMFIEAGSMVSVHDLLMGIVVQSGNDASVALAEHVAGSEEVFTDLMNKRASDLQLKHSYFTNTTGLPGAQHKMSTRDIARLSQVLIRDYPQYYGMYSAEAYTYNDIRQANRNALLWRNMGVDGLKTGYTADAGYCLAASAIQDGMRLIVVVMGSARHKRFDEASDLLRYGYRFYKTSKLFESRKPLTEVRVWGGSQPQLALGVPEDIYVTLPRTRSASIKTEIVVDKDIIAPIPQGQKLGSITVSFGDQPIKEGTLISLQAIDKGGLWTRLSDSVLHLFQ